MVNTNQGKRPSQNNGRPGIKISLLEARKWAISELTTAGFEIEEATDNVDFLLTGALNVNYGMLRANLSRQMHPWLAERWPTWIAGLLKSVPAQYLLGQAPFYGEEFYVDDRVLIPRPETELLVEWILSDLKNEAAANHHELGPTVLDIGTGSGAIILTLAKQWPNLRGIGADLSQDALVVAQKNRDKFDLAGRVGLVESDLFTALEGQRFDVIVSNPPYIRPDAQSEMDVSVQTYEPEMALYADDNGLALYKQMAQGLADHLNPGGGAYFEIGYDQGPALVAVFQAALPDADVTLKQDLAGLDRMIQVRLKNENN
ncbi:peptide chain release factor N(5)-glutamine methyltransferase [Fructobacillus ficulneus]|uniref:Release factor glutamine methyltransferase n=1 Tax=Fructobacillus ficulneus TaxID=157463 RepID=A0A0K8MHH5_9LACO|nr:peptide chain release factor N(5)-glutamine methyltransferase [Fructobacillus ficulneus]GAO99349.1 polypeptide chain release factor methylase [Fructobacillus ficulneus]